MLCRLIALIPCYPWYFGIRFLCPIGNGNINHIQLSVKDDNDVRFVFHVVAQIPPFEYHWNVFADTSKRYHSFGLSSPFNNNK